jgi:hypothetical protein
MLDHHLGEAMGMFGIALGMDSHAIFGQLLLHSAQNCHHIDGGTGSDCQQYMLHRACRHIVATRFGRHIEQDSMS